MPLFDEKEFLIFAQQFPKVKQIAVKKLSELFKKIGGLPIVAKSVVNYLEKHSPDISEFCLDYEKKKLQLLPIHSIWDMTLSKIESSSKFAWKLLKIAAFLDNNDIPLVLLQTTAHLMEEKFQQALSILNDNSVLKNNKTNTLSFHDLVQESILLKITEPQKIKLLNRIALIFHEIFKDNPDIKGIANNHYFYINFLRFYLHIQQNFQSLDNNSRLLVARSCHTAFSYQMRTQKMNEKLLANSRAILTGIEISTLDNRDMEMFHESWAVHKNVQVWHKLLIKDFQGLKCILNYSTEAIQYWQQRLQRERGSEFCLRSLLVTSSNYAFALFQTEHTQKYHHAIQILKNGFYKVPPHLRKQLAHQLGQCFSALGHLYFKLNNFFRACEALQMAFNIFMCKKYFPQGHANLAYVEDWLRKAKIKLWENFDEDKSFK